MKDIIESFSGDEEMGRLMGQVAEHVEALPVAIIVLKPNGKLAVVAPTFMRHISVLVSKLVSTLDLFGA